MQCNKIKQQLKLPQNLSANPPINLRTPICIAKADSGATNHYFRPNDSSTLEHVSPANGPQIMLPNNMSLTATNVGLLPIKHLTPKGRRAHIIPGLESASLLSMGQLCDDGCEVRLRKTDMDVRKGEQTILHGVRNHTDGLWDIHLSNDITQNPVTHKANIIVSTKAISDLVAYYHGCLFSPTKSTWLTALKNNNFPTWPGLTVERVQKYYPDTLSTAKGHLDQEQQNLRSTKPAIIPLSTHDHIELQNDFSPRQESPTPSNNIMSIIIPFVCPRTAYCDLTGKFPFKSSRGNQYIMVFYNYDANYINAITLRTRQAGEIKNAFEQHTTLLQQSGITPSMFILDNEISNDFKNSLNKYKIPYQLVPPAQHRRNAAERAIRTFKNHFFAGLSFLPGKFPMSEWDRLLPQALLSLNLLRTARLNPNLSAHTFVNGIHNFNQNPFSPPNPS